MLYRSLLSVNPHTAIMEGGYQYYSYLTEDRIRQKRLSGFPKVHR